MLEQKLSAVLANGQAGSEARLRGETGHAAEQAAADANELVAEIHDCMPLILASGDYARG
jgi:hypothetical protein